MTTSDDRRTVLGRRRWTLLVLSAAAAGLAALAACGSSGNSTSNPSTSSPSTSSPSTSSPSTRSPSTGNSSHAPAAAGSLKVAHVGKATVLTDSKGLTLYSFAPDTAAKSACSGPCAVNWPPVKGPVATSGVKGTFTTITRSDGSTQETFNGHPLYTFIGDKSPGQANGNGLNAFGGVWKEITTSGTAPAGTPSTGGSGGGYGY
jgi:predicted lipoprotein with Yx(FWY)xxD motif